MGFFSSSEDETTWSDAHAQVNSADHKVGPGDVVVGVAVIDVVRIRRPSSLMS